MDEPPGLNRRDLLKLGAAVAATVATGERLSALSSGLDQVSVPAATRFFTAEESALVDELCELIIPADDHSPGARAAGVARFIDARLAEAWDEGERTGWRDGLKRLDQLSRDANSRPFLQSSADERVALLTRIARNEKNPIEPEERFFATLKTAVVDAYYTSEIGIKQEMEYKGNTYLPEFAGEDVS
jgi:Gluconate 2-dehydrogenase subunit 3